MPESGGNPNAVSQMATMVLVKPKKVASGSVASQTSGMLMCHFTLRFS